MAPDINTLPPSRSPSGSPSQSRFIPSQSDGLRRDTPSPLSRSNSVSLAAAAAMNASMQNQQDSRRSSTSSASRNRGASSTMSPQQVGRQERRRSTVLMNLNLNDPALPGPGEMQTTDYRHNAFRTASPHSRGGSPSTADPHHQRAPSLGELHQELEAEQEAQVNRLLQMIRQQQQQLQQLQQASGQPPGTTAAVDDSTPTSERSLSFPTTLQSSTTFAHPRPRSPAPFNASRGSIDLSRQSSRRSRGSSRDQSSPAIRATSIPPSEHDGAWALGGSRDESAFYQAETQTLTRENQMLKLRIRELERQVHELNMTASTTPALPSHLSLSQENSELLPSTADESKD